MLAFYGSCLTKFKWLGIRPTDIMAEHNSCLTFPMTKKDVKAVEAMLEDADFKTRLEWHQELQIMLKNKQKIAIESLAFCGVRSYLTDVFLPMKLQLEDWI
jgi:DNA topoisomerase VI subunit A